MYQYNTEEVNIPLRFFTFYGEIGLSEDVGIMRHSNSSGGRNWIRLSADQRFPCSIDIIRKTENTENGNINLAQSLNDDFLNIQISLPQNIFTKKKRYFGTIRTENGNVCYSYIPGLFYTVWLYRLYKEENNKDRNKNVLHLSVQDSSQMVSFTLRCIRVSKALDQTSSVHSPVYQDVRMGSKRPRCKSRAGAGALFNIYIFFTFQYLICVLTADSHRDTSNYCNS